MKTLEEFLPNIPFIESKLGYVFQDKSLLVLAFTHRSYANENRSLTGHNERLEFLGDSVLGLVISEQLYRNLPTTAEGQLSALRSRLIDASSCAVYIQKLGVDDFIMLGKGERTSNGRGRITILADLFEAVVGAIFMEGGIEPVRKLFLDNFHDDLLAIFESPATNWKAQLQDYCQKYFQTTPTYTVVSEEGPDHSKIFKILVAVQNRTLGEGTGSSKKAAQQSAAQNACSRLNEESHGG